MDSNVVTYNGAVVCTMRQFLQRIACFSVVNENFSVGADAGEAFAGRGVSNVLDEFSMRFDSLQVVSDVWMTS